MNIKLILDRKKNFRLVSVKSIWSWFFHWLFLRNFWN